MSVYLYKALDKNGVVIKGQTEARTKNEALDTLLKRRLEVYEIKETKAQSSLLAIPKRVKPKDLAKYIRQMATLLNAGVSLLDALSSLAKSNAHKSLAKSSEKIRTDLRSGERLSVSLEKHIPALPLYVARLAELGESTGKSAKALTDAADRMEYENAMRSEIKSSLSYPIFLSVVGGAIVFLMFLFVVPRFDVLIGDNRDNLPAISRLVLSMGTSLKENLWTIVIVVIVGVGALMVFLRRTSNRHLFRSVFEKMPMVGPMLVQADLGGWARTMGIALDNGADLLSALKLGELSVRSPRIRSRLEYVRAEIRAGRNIDEALSENIPDFDPLTLDMIRTGRTSSRLPEMLLFIGDSQEAQIRDLTKRLSGLAEPIAILLIAMIVGTIVISIVLAMTSLYDFAI